MPYTRMRYHLVFSTKNRQRWILPSVEEFLYPVMRQIAKKNQSRIVQIGGVEDHVHLLFAMPPTLCIATFVACVKSNSSAAVKRGLPYMKHFQWQEEYSCFTVGAGDYERIYDYVRNQKIHHRKNTLRPNFELIDDDV